MTQPIPRSLTEFIPSQRGLTRLGLWFVWTWLAPHPEETFVIALRERVNGYHHTDVFPGTTLGKAALFA